MDKINLLIMLILFGIQMILLNAQDCPANTCSFKDKYSVKHIYKLVIDSQQDKTSEFKLDAKFCFI